MTKYFKAYYPKDKEDYFFILKTINKKGHFVVVYSTFPRLCNIKNQYLGFTSDYPFEDLFNYGKWKLKRLSKEEYFLEVL